MSIPLVHMDFGEFVAGETDSSRVLTAHSTKNGNSWGFERNGLRRRRTGASLRKGCRQDLDPTGSFELHQKIISSGELGLKIEPAESVVGRTFLDSEMIRLFQNQLLLWLPIFIKFPAGAEQANQDHSQGSPHKKSDNDSPKHRFPSLPDYSHNSFIGIFLNFLMKFPHWIKNSFQSLEWSGPSLAPLETSR